MIVAFLFFWGIGLVTELQRTEPLSLAKFLHLPVSVNGAFLINYLSSLLRLSLIIFGPVMLGFGLALVVAKGILLLPVLPLLAAFLLMVTALTYQFQGWLASLMSNPRRRRTVVVVTTVIFVLIVQLPNLLNFFAPWGSTTAGRPAKDWRKNWRSWIAMLDRGRNRSRRVRASTAGSSSKHRASRAAGAARNGTLGADGPARESGLAGRVAAAGRRDCGGGPRHAVDSGAAGDDLDRNRQSLAGLPHDGPDCIRGSPPTGKPAGAGAAAQPPASDRKPGGLLLEARLPGLSEPVSAIALGGFRSLVRSPEAKMMLLTPVIMIPIFGSMLWRGVARFRSRSGRWSRSAGWASCSSACCR